MTVTPRTVAGRVYPGYGTGWVGRGLYRYPPITLPGPIY